MSTTEEQLSAAVAVLGRIMLEMQRRRLEATRGIPFEGAISDDKIGAMAADAFDSGATHLASIGSALFTFSLSEEPCARS